MSDEARVSTPREVELDAKIAFLRRADSYPETRPGEPVAFVQTHMSCVFLTEHHAYKLKKPVRHSFLDFTTLEARRHYCQEELRLNRRLAREVYLAVLPLTQDRYGALAVDGRGEPVDWLVKMRRLPRALMLDQALTARTVGPEDVRRFATVLARFYRHAAPLGVNAHEYRKRFEDGVIANHRVLTEPRYGLSPAEVEQATHEQRTFLDSHADLLTRRVRQRRIVEGHGDLRPEHVCLAPAPVFIDCLEFNPAFRVLDPADELAYLGMECELLGAPFVGEVALATYTAITEDAPPTPLVDFYKAYRATVRARLSVLHLDDHARREHARWVSRGQRYLGLARRYGARAIMPATDGAR
ncbi:hypothetical protein HUS23_14170 [Ectothiorhodospiraceae bacterium 2226]|nr:hypothetical protein HUS23_14170 [Ectothiorhodospiraceae bacterium 2226]